MDLRYQKIAPFFDVSTHREAGRGEGGGREGSEGAMTEEDTDTVHISHSHMQRGRVMELVCVISNTLEVLVFPIPIAMDALRDQTKAQCIASIDAISLNSPLGRAKHLFKHSEELVAEVSLV